MRRREFITLIGGTAASVPFAARAQHQSAPVVAFLSSLTQPQTAPLAMLWKQGLAETGYTEGNNLTIQYHFADGQYDRLPALAAELARRQVALIVTAGPPAALAAKRATNAIPIVFVVGNDPVADRLVERYSRPGGNVTGITLITGPLGQKRLELIRDFAPGAKAVPLLVNPTTADTELEIRDVREAAKAAGLDLQVVNARTPGEIDVAFEALAERRPELLMVGSDPFFTSRREQLVAWAGRIRVPTIYPFREFPAIGGLISYGASIGDAARQAGIYCGRILRGASPADLPVLQPTKFELVLNLKTATALGLTVPGRILALADTVIE